MRRAKQLLIASFVFVVLAIAGYLVTAFNFHRENFGPRLYGFTHVGLWVEDTPENRKQVAFLKPALALFGNGWNIYWMNDADEIVDADPMLLFP
ncbi:MAG: hypothetical protein P1U89_20770 [Verrucomicrobiales bacterium]|nr:hypothetical protein [Verrucomicrobiales bacterium]